MQLTYDQPTIDHLLAHVPPADKINAVTQRVDRGREVKLG